MKFANRKKTGVGLILILVIALSSMAMNRDDKLFDIDKNLDIFYSLIRELNLFYVDDIDVNEIMRTGVDEMLSSLDPYTTFIPESDMEDFKFMTTGEYAGVGAIIGKRNNQIIVSEPYKGFPADKAGLKAGDVILEVEGKSTENMSVEDVSNLLKGASKESVSVKVQRYGEKKSRLFNVVRENIQIDAVPYYGMLNDEVGYIRLSSFTANCGSEVRKLIKELKENQNAKSMILDLRGNPGGLLHESVKIVSAFVPKNTKVVYTKGKVKQWDAEYFTKLDPIDTTMAVAVLVNRGSASASEIVSGALQDLDRGVVIGTRTFGKGLVQTTRDLSFNAKLKVTTAKYYVPSGRCIQALDYSNRNEDGSVGIVADSLISEFKTKNGRIVYDGGGITPDVKVNLPEASSLTYNLIREFAFFDYATKFYYENEQIESPEKFEITDQMYANFKAYLTEKEFNYESETEKALKKLIKTAKKEKYYDMAQDEFNKLQDRVAHELDKDLNEFSVEIKEMLKDEIVTRFHYQEGAIRASLVNDKYIERAKGIVASQDSIAKYFTSGTIIEKEK